MEIIYLNPKDLKPYENNAKKHPKDQVEHIANSIKQFGFKQPIVIDKDNVVIIGHGRLKASIELNLKQVPCVIADDLTEEQIKALRLADNKTNESEWDNLLLDLELNDIDTIDMSDFGFNILQDEEETEEDDFNEDENTDEEPISKYGDLYKLGNNYLLCGDSTKIEDVERLMGGYKANLLFTDPPYGMDLDTDFSGMKSKIFKGGNGGNYYDEGIVDTFTPEMIKTIFDLDIKETFLWGADYYAELLPNKNEGSWIVWDKRANGNDDIEEDYSSDKMYGSCFELCWSKNKHKRDIARVKWAGMFGMEKQDTKTRVHPTQKPIALCEWFLKRFSKEKDIVLDLFGGSGSTLIACEQLNRQCYMMELDPHYCDVIIKRWENYTGKKAELLKGE